MHHGIRRPLCIVEMLGGVWASDLGWGLEDGWKDLISSRKELLRWECHAKYPNATNYLIIYRFFVVIQIHHLHNIATVYAPLLSPVCCDIPSIFFGAFNTPELPCWCQRSSTKMLISKHVPCATPWIHCLRH